MYKISGINIHYQRYPFTYFLDSLVRLGVEYVELWAGEPHFSVYGVTPYKLRQIEREISVRGLKTICFTPEQCKYPVNVAAKDDEYRQRSIEYFRKSIDITCDLGTDTLLCTCGLGYYDEDRSEPMKRAVDSIRKIAEMAEKEGITLAIETMTHFATNVANTIDELDYLVRAVDMPNVKPMLDNVPSTVAGETVQMYIDRFGSDLHHIHFLDGDGVTGSHLALGDGVYPLDDFIRSMQNGYDRYVTPEIDVAKYYLDPEAALKKSVDRLRTIVK